MPRRRCSPRGTLVHSSGCPAQNSIVNIAGLPRHQQNNILVQGVPTPIASTPGAHPHRHRAPEHHPNQSRAPFAAQTHTAAHHFEYSGTFNLANQPPTTNIYPLENTLKHSAMQQQPMQPIQQQPVQQQAKRQDPQLLSLVHEFQYLLEKSQQLFAGLRDLPPTGRNWQPYFQRTFEVYTRLWKFQQQHRPVLEDRDYYGLKRWEIGEIASKIGQLYYHYYLRTSETSYLHESFIFYEAIRDRQYFKTVLDAHSVTLMIKKLRYYARFIVVCLLLNRTPFIKVLIDELSVLVSDYARVFNNVDSAEWSVVLSEITTFLEAERKLMPINSTTNQPFLDLSSRLITDQQQYPSLSKKHDGSKKNVTLINGENAKSDIGTKSKSEGINSNETNDKDLPVGDADKQTESLPVGNGTKLVALENLTVEVKTDVKIDPKSSTVIDPQTADKSIVKIEEKVVPTPSVINNSSNKNSKNVNTKETQTSINDRIVIDRVDDDPVALPKLKLKEAIVVGNNKSQIKFSELTLDMYRILQALEKELSQNEDAQQVQQQQQQQSNSSLDEPSRSNPIAVNGDPKNATTLTQEKHRSSPTSGNENREISQSRDGKDVAKSSGDLKSNTKLQPELGAIPSATQNLNSNLDNIPNNDALASLDKNNSDSTNKRNLNPHKYLLFRPTIAQLLLYLATSMKDCCTADATTSSNEHSAMFLYISSDGISSKISTNLDETASTSVSTTTATATSTATTSAAAGSAAQVTPQPHPPVTMESSTSPQQPQTDSDNPITNVASQSAISHAAIAAASTNANVDPDNDAGKDSKVVLVHEDKDGKEEDSSTANATNSMSTQTIDQESAIIKSLVKENVFNDPRSTSVRSGFIGGVSTAPMSTGKKLKQQQQQQQQQHKPGSKQTSSTTPSGGITTTSTLATTTVTGTNSTAAATATATSTGPSSSSAANSTTAAAVSAAKPVELTGAALESSASTPSSNMLGTSSGGSVSGEKSDHQLATPAGTVNGGEENERKKGDSGKQGAGKSSTLVGTSTNPTGQVGNSLDLELTSSKKHNGEEVEDSFADLDCLHPFDLLPFTRKYLLVIVDSNNSTHFKNVPTTIFGKNNIILLSPENVPEGPWSQGNAGLTSRRISGSLYTLFLHSPLKAFLQISQTTNLTEETMISIKSTLADLESLIRYKVLSYKVGIVDRIFRVISQDPFLARFIVRHILAGIILHSHKVFGKLGKTVIPQSNPNLPDVPLICRAVPETRILLDRLVDLASAHDHFD